MRVQKCERKVRRHYLEGMQDSKRSSVLAHRIITSAGRVFDAQDLHFFPGDILYKCYVIRICVFWTPV